MKRFLFIIVYLLFFFLLFTFSSGAQKPDSVQKFIDSALVIMQQHSMYAPELNWKKIKDSVAVLSKGAKTYTETATALHYAFNQLGDKHGRLVINDSSYFNTVLPQLPNRINEAMRLAASKGARIYTGKLQDKYAYLSIPFFNDQTISGTNAFAQRLQDSLCKVLAPSVKGLILDLRLNAGGNTQAMVVGVSNVFGNQSPIEGKPYIGDWKIENHGLALNDTFVIRLQHACGNYSKLPVAVLIGPQTASAGEFLALGFAGRKHTVLIGERTAGYTSGNNGFLLPGDGNGIVVAEDYAVDKKGRIYDNGLDAAIQITGGDDFFNRSKDLKIAAAIKWLSNQKAS